MRAKYLEAIVSVEIREPAGVFKEKWYAIDSDCHGCWHTCGNTHGQRDPSKVDADLQELVSRIVNCTQREINTTRTLHPVKIHVLDGRKKQALLEAFQ